jgi:hypothetical protein
VVAAVTGAELLVGGSAIVLVSVVLAKAWVGSRRVEIVQVRTRRVLVFGRSLVLAMVIVGAQWLTILHSDNRILLLGLLGLPALITSFVLVKAFTVTEVGPRGRSRR